MRKGVKWDILISQGSDISNDLKWRPKGRPILNLHWYKTPT